MKGTAVSYPLEVPVGSESTSKITASKNVTSLSNTGGSGLTYKQQLKQDAMLWAEFLYSEYKREKTPREEAQTMPTHYDNPDA